MIYRAVAADLWQGGDLQPSRLSPDWEGQKTVDMD